MSRHPPERTLWSVNLRADGSPRPDSYWRSLHYFNVYRIGIGAICLLAAGLFSPTITFGSRDLGLFYSAGAGYVLVSAASVLLINSRALRFNLQLGAQVGADVAFITLLMYASGGIQSGLGLLLLPSLAGAALISRGKLALFFASLASIAVLLEETYGILRFGVPTAQYVQAGLLSIGYFATAWLARMLARYTVGAEQLALQRGIDLANLAQVNQLVIQDMQDGVLVVDAEGRVRQKNTQAQRLLGGALGGASLSDYSAQLAERFQRWRRDPGTSFDLLRIPLTNRLVRTRFVLLGESPDFGAVIFLEDMSRVQAQAQQLKFAALGRLTANIAHEIRNPLSAITHAAELLLEEKGHNPTQARLLAIVRENARRLNRMVQDVLQLNRSEEASAEAFPPGAFLTDFIEEFCHGEKVPPAVFSLRVTTDRTVCFDRTHLNQVLWNLCRNAWRHCSKQDGSIRLWVTDGPTANQVAIDVIDDGLGVGADLRGQLFEPFFTTAPGGTGLGLYIAREICEANGATLDCLETDTGAHFRVLCRRDHVKAQRASDAIR